VDVLAHGLWGGAGFVFHAYNLTQSLVVWSFLFGLIWMWKRHPPWVFLAWGLHILCDIPTHSSAYFPTPFLWPLPTVWAMKGSARK